MEDGERSEPSEHECPQGSPVEWLGERSEPNREHRTGLVCFRNSGFVGPEGPTKPVIPSF